MYNVENVEGSECECKYKCQSKVSVLYQGKPEQKESRMQLWLLMLLTNSAIRVKGRQAFWILRMQELG
jgi:hypothetical protein